MKKKTTWHNLDSKEVVKVLSTDIGKGLSEKETKIRQEKFGKNLLLKEKPLSRLRIFLEQFQSLLIYILVTAGIVTFALGKQTDTIVIFIAVFVNALFGFWEENKVSKILEKLKRFLKTKAIVLRDGQKREIFQEELVPGDIIFLQAGDRIPADGRLIESKNLKISEAVLTGEWLPSTKTPKILPEDTPLADRDNMVYLGCLVEGGEGKAVVVATGSKTETGKIATLIRETEEEKTPLQRKLAYFSKRIAVFLGIVSILIFVGGILRGENLLIMFETAVAITVGGIPEALPVVMTVILAIGMERILKKRGLVRRLASVETLGSTQIICFDKTRTLTQGKMELAEVMAKDQNLALKIAVLCSEAFVENPQDPPRKWKLWGSPTGKALVKAGAEREFLKPKLEKRSIELARFPFNSTYKYQLSLRKENEETFLYICGAPERLLKKSKNKKGWEEDLEKLTAKGLRVVGVGFKKIKNQKSKIKNLNKLADDFIFVGLIAFKDPLRPDVKEAVKVCQTAGMRPILVTGDHKLTAKAAAQEIGLKITGENILEGIELDQLSDQDFRKILEKIKVYARVEPRHKMRIVSQWQKKGKVVAMTGDGVNDAPALKKADIGIAVGSGTEVAKEASDLVLLSDGFGVIIKTIEEGRTILDNLRKAISYILADSLTSVILIGLTKIIFGWPLPILPAQVLWNNFVEDTMPNIAYAFEPKEKGVMRRKPAPLKAPLLTKEMKILIFFTGLIDEFLIILLFWYLWRCLSLGLDYARTMVFGAICVDTAFVVYCYKNLRKNIWQINPFSNKWLNMASALVFIFFALAIYLTPVQKILHTVPLGIGSWLILVLVGIVSMLLIEITKWHFISRHEAKEQP